EVGVGSIIEVTDAETIYTDAQTTYIRTIYDYKIADAQLARAMRYPGRRVETRIDQVKKKKRGAERVAA
ncbi:MAG TPA: TolC family protein, partial [Candidatus Eisenbacteria bacterium]|nr:TolC family protein [Candidatus Eisenbacteria bacterium]